MKIDQLTYFIEAARVESVGKASRALAISPSAISHAISALETELGKALFIREKQRIVLTAHGRLFMIRIEKILNELRSLKEEMSSESAELEGSFRVASTHSLAVRCVVPAWNQLKKLHPKLMLELQTMRSTEILASVASGSLDLGVCMEPPKHPAIHSEELHTDRVAIVVRSHHPCLKLKSRQMGVALSQLPGAAPMTARGLKNFESHPTLTKLKILHEVDFTYDSYEVAVQRVLGSDSWTLLPEWLIGKYGSKLAAVPLPGWDATLKTQAIWPKSRPPAQALKKLMEAMTEGLAKKML